MNKFLNIFTFCKIIKGTEQSIICDFQKLSIKYIPNSMVEVINMLENNEYLNVKNEFNDQKDIFKSYVSFLINEKFAFFSDERDNFMPLDTNWSSPEIINNSIIEYNFEKYDLKKTLTQLDNLNCKFIELRFLSFDDEKFIEIEKILNHCNDFGFRSLRIFIPFIDHNICTKIYHKFKKFKKIEVIVFYNSPKEKLIYNIQNTVFVKHSMEEIRFSNFNDKDIIIDLKYYLEAQKYNPYYNKKVSVDLKGNIKNCVKNKTIHGNVNDTNLKTIVQSSKFQEFWYITHDKIIDVNENELRYNMLISNDLKRIDNDFYQIIE